MLYTLTAAILIIAACQVVAGAYYEAPSLEPLNSAAQAPPDEELAYLLPRVLAKYAPEGSSWEAVSDPRFYLLTELEKNFNQAAARNKRTGGVPSLSIVNPLDVLRQRLLLEIARRRMRQSENQIMENRKILKNVGKRDVSQLQAEGGNSGFDTDMGFQNGDISENIIEERDMRSDDSRSADVGHWDASGSRWSNDLASSRQS